MRDNFFEIKNVDFKIGNKVKVKNVSFSIEKEGDIICLLGPSGIGKTTILRTIAGLENINKGSIALKGKTLSSENINIEPEKRNISLAFQENSLFPHYTVKKNILLGAERNEIKKDKSINFEELINLLDISHILNKFPHEISAGEAQRASLARSLNSNPDLLLLDEPLSYVDQSLKEEIQVSVKKLLKRINPSLKEIIIATNPSTSGNATALYLEKILKDKNVEISRLAVGLPVGSNLEYIDDKTISSAISGRVKLS